MLAALAPALVLLASAAPANDAPALVRRCVDAYGGKAALARTAARRDEGSVTSLLHPGVLGHIRRAYRRPGKLRVEVQFDEPEIRIVDGGRGWRQGVEVSGMHLASMLLQAARLDLPSLLSAWRDKIEDRGTTELDGRTLRVLAVRIAPGLSVEAAVDPASGRILRSRGTSTGGPNLLEFITTYSDFRTVAGVLVPFRETNYANGATTGETVLASVDFPDDVPERLFRP